MSNINFASVQIGDKLPAKSISVSQDFIYQYADLCGDYNPIHVDLEFANKHPIFKGTIAHGTINVEPVLQAIGAIQGTGWPVEGTRIDLQFRAPVRPGDTITSNLVVKEKKTESGKNILLCDMTIANAAGNCVLGTTEIIVP